MPIFQLRCHFCGHEEEQLILYTDEKVTTTCPVCTKEMKQSLSMFSRYDMKGNNDASVTPKKFRTQEK